jgi:hypothetical protein
MPDNTVALFILLNDFFSSFSIAINMNIYKRTFDEKYINMTNIISYTFHKQINGPKFHVFRKLIDFTSNKRVYGVILIHKAQQYIIKIQFSKRIYEVKKS